MPDYLIDIDLANVELGKALHRAAHFADALTWVGANKCRDRGRGRCDIDCPGRAVCDTRGLKGYQRRVEP